MTAGGAAAATDCTFSTSGTTMTLNADCTTDATIVVPDGFTLDGDSHTITAVDPAGDHFRGGVVENGGDEAYVEDLGVTASNLSNACDGAGGNDDRLRGILLNGASGSVTDSTVTGINQGASGCQEGNAIEARNSGAAATAVEIAHNTVDDYQKTGIVSIGNVDVDVHHNDVGDSATQQNLAANSVQISSRGTVTHNAIEGNQWLGSSNWGGTAVLVQATTGAVEVSKNNIDGNSDVGIYVVTTGGVVVDNNRVSDEGNDGTNGDYGIVDYYGANEVTNNKVRGFDYPYYGVDGGKNKTVGGPQKHEAF